MIVAAWVCLLASYGAYIVTLRFSGAGHGYSDLAVLVVPLFLIAGGCAVASIIRERKRRAVVHGTAFLIVWTLTGAGFFKVAA